MINCSKILGFLFFWVRYPYVTGTSVVAIKYKDGILMASDMGGMILSLPSLSSLVVLWMN